MGLLFGYILFKLRGKPLGISGVACLWIWALAGLIGALCVYGPYDAFVTRPFDGKQVGLAETVIYLAFSKLAWSVALGWVILACVKGVGGPIDTILSWGLFTPLARMSYCIYLVHMTVIMWIGSLGSYTVTYSVPIAIYYIISCSSLSW